MIIKNYEIDFDLKKILRILTEAIFFDDTILIEKALSLLNWLI